MSAVELPSVMSVAELQHCTLCLLVILPFVLSMRFPVVRNWIAPSLSSVSVRVGHMIAIGVHASPNDAWHLLSAPARKDDIDTQY